MIKSRTLNADVGDHPQCKYWNSGTACPKTSGLYIDRMARPAWYYYEGRTKAASLSNVPSNLGSQRFESSTRRMPKFNNCENIRYQGFNLPFLIILEHPTNTGYVSSMMDYNRKAVVGAFSNVGTVPIISWAEADASQRRAWWAMQPRFESEVSMLNFIYELKDFKHLFKMVCNFNWKSLANKVGRIRENVRHMEKQKKLLDAAKTPAAALEIWAKIRLYNEMAIKPLISDIGNILDLINETVDAAQGKFAERGEQASINHYTEVLDDIRTGTFGTGNNACFFVGKHTRTTFTATLEFTYEYKMRIGLEKYKRAWGLEVTPEVVWNGIPFSFLIDYFLKIGRSLHDMSLDPNVLMTTLQYSESLLNSVEYGTSIDTTNGKVLKFFMPCKTKNGAEKLTPGLHLISGYSGTHYKRRVGTPNKGAGLPRLVGLTNGHALNILALVTSFIKR